MTMFPVFVSLSTQITQMDLPGALLMSLVGMAIVMFALTMILWLVKLQGVLVPRFAGVGKSRLPAAAEPEGGTASAPGKPQGVTSPGSLGDVSLHGVPDKTAAMIMAIVADETGVPLGELRFKSIKEE